MSYWNTKIFIFLDLNQMATVCSLPPQMLFVEIIGMLMMREYQEQRRTYLNSVFYRQDPSSVSLSDK